MPHLLPVGGLTPIVAATEADLDALVTLLAHLFNQEAEFSPNADAQRRGLLHILHHPEVGQLLVARREGQVLGMVNLLYTFSTSACTASAALPCHPWCRCGSIECRVFGCLGYLGLGATFSI